MSMTNLCFQFGNITIESLDLLSTLVREYPQLYVRDIQERVCDIGRFILSSTHFGECSPFFS